MSGIVGIYHRNGAPIERALLQALLDFLAYRGPDAREFWMEGSVGLGHAMLRTTREAEGERQPASLDKRFWIVADARLDGRAELIAGLRRAGRVVRANAPDSELLLNAYAAWGTPCVERLLGDFSFAIWDASHKHLFCARDHFGIKPFYYAQLGDAFVFSNTLNCVRVHPLASEELNDAAIGDFLLFGLNYDNSTTTFRDVQRLAPAHCLTFAANGLRIKRYWKLPTDGRIRYGNPVEYVENFQSIFQAAVADKVRTNRVGILLSGGLDSSSVAAVAKEVLAKSSSTTEICGYTLVYESLIPHQEKEYARDTGKFLGIPIKFIPIDETQLFERWDDPAMSSPEPMDNPLFAGVFDYYRQMSADGRVLVSGEGNDNLMDFQMWPYVRDLRRNGEWLRLSSDVANYLWIRPFPWRGIRARVLRFAGKDPFQFVFPRWLAPEFSQRMNLTARWQECLEQPKLSRTHPIHPRGHGSFSLPQWTRMFEQENAGVTYGLVETRYPFLDLRVVNYLLAIPPFPWFFRKTLLRDAMSGLLPEHVRKRPKTPLQGFPVIAQLRRRGAERLKQIPLSSELDRYIERSAVAPPDARMSIEEVNTGLRPYSLNVWLRLARKIRYNLHGERGDE